MIDDKFAQTFVTNLSATTDYRAQIIDSSGFIIASDQPKNLGTFHDVAYQILCGEGTVVTHRVKGYENRLTVCLPLMQDNVAIGVLEVTGNEKNVSSYASVIKLSLEVMSAYAHDSIRMQKYSSKSELFVQRLLYDTQVTQGELEARATALGYKYDCMRVPVFIITAPAGDMAALVSQGADNPCYNSQDILTLSRSGHITLYIYLGYGEDVLRSYRNTVAEYLVWWQRALDAQGLHYTMHVGSIQNTLSYYRVGYDHAVWLNNIAHCKEPVNWFYDHTKDYLEYCIPLIEYRGMFNVFSSTLPQEFLSTYVELISSLAECDYSLQPASQKLFIHKNTLSFRLAKIKDALGINPMQDYRNRDFANNLCRYLKAISS